MKIYVVNGFPGVGKTTFEKECLKQHPGRVSIFSTVDIVKKVARVCGWNGEKTPENRKFLSDLKKLLKEWGDIPWKDIQSKIEMAQNVERFETYESIAFIDSREPDELERFRRENGAKIILIRRPSVESHDQSNTSDANVLNFDYDIVFNNDGTPEELKEKVSEFLKNN